MGVRSQGHKLFGPHYNFQDFKGSIKYAQDGQVIMLQFKNDR